MTYGYYAESRDDPTKLVYIRPKRITSFEQLRHYDTIGAALFKKHGAFYVNEILDTSDTDISESESTDGVLLGLDNMPNPIPRNFRRAPRRMPTATVSQAPESDNADDENNAGQIEFVSDDSDNYVVVSDDNRQTDSSDKNETVIEPTRKPVAKSVITKAVNKQQKETSTEKNTDDNAANMSNFISDNTQIFFNIDSE